ncbi:MAG: type II secretion system protein [Patescibacteria group bacterium]
MFGFNNKKNNNKAFTIVELLVVIAIIAVLLAVVSSLWGDSKKKSRDARREEDIKEIQNALNLYVTNAHIYPICPQTVMNGSTDCLSTALVGGGFISMIPVDPLNGFSGTCGAVNEHVYCYTSDGFTYTIEYSLETDNILGKSAGWQSVAQ